MNILQKPTTFLLDFFFPKFCYGCGKSGKYICAECVQVNMKINWEQKCHVCGGSISMGFVHKECAENSYLDGLIFFTAYDGIAKKIIHDAKYEFYFDALNDVGNMMANYLRTYKLDKEFIVTDIPLNNRKKRFRGFNQAEIIAKRIASRSGLKYISLIERTKDTKTQVLLDKDHRAENLKDVFRVILMNREINLDGQKVLLIDDVYTTGATLNECAKALKSSGVQQVLGFVFAKSRL